MDGFDTSAGVIILAATNRPEILDPLLRAGRFDRQVLVDRPDLKGRIDVLRVHARKVKLASEVDLGQIAAMTPGFAGADLANLINEAAMLATRRAAEVVAMADLTAAIERIVGGLEKKLAFSTLTSARPSPITKWDTRWSRWHCPVWTRCKRSLSFHAVSVRWATPYSGSPAIASL